MVYRITPENAHAYEGKKLDSDKKFHYYPIKPVHHPSLGWCFVDRYGVMQRIPDEGVYFERVAE